MEDVGGRGFGHRLEHINIEVHAMCLVCIYAYAFACMSFESGCSCGKIIMHINMDRALTKS